MEILRSAAEYSAGPCVVAMGMFDGVHVGHRALIRRAGEEARRMGLPLVVYTYAEHPLQVLRPQLAPQALTNAQEKARLLGELGADVVIMNRFTRETAATPARTFLRELCGALQPALIAAGYNHSFGHKGEGNAQLMREMAAELGYKVLILEPVEQGGGPVSSSRIRQLLSEGRLREAKALLGQDE
ncbi:MAG: FAD synthetase family protein [Eubacteriales bacterium]|nr:FAD synthetase family protein [Eubacteriales bacterium]